MLLFMKNMKSSLSLFFKEIFERQLIKKKSMELSVQRKQKQSEQPTEMISHLILHLILENTINIIKNKPKSKYVNS